MDILKYVVCAILLLAYVNGKSSNRLLTQAMMSNYDKLTIPDGSPLNVSHSLQIRRIVGLEDQILSLDAYIWIQWRDDQLAWDPADYGGITMNRLPSGILWKPDIILENSAEQFTGLHSGDINMVISYDGEVFYIPPVKIKSYCSVDSTRLRKNSEVKCTLKFMSWTYDGLSLNLEPGAEGGILSDFDAGFNKDWRLIDASVKRNVKTYACCPEPYIDITYTLVLKAR